MRVVLRFIVLMSLSSGVVNAATVEPLSLTEAQRTALSGSPVLAEIKARYQAALEVPEQRGALPDPVITVGMINVPTDTFDLDQEAMTQFRVGFSQALPWASERRLARSSAEQQAKATAAELEETRNRLRRDVSRSWWSLHFIDNSLAVVEENLQRLREFNRIAQSRYRVGKGLQQDTLQAQLQLSAQLERQLVLQGKRRNVEAQLNALLAQPESHPITLTQETAVLSGELHSLASMIDSALQQRPWLHQRQRMVDAARDKQQLAREGLLPDLTLGVAYGYRQDAPNGNSRADLASIQLGIKLPFYSSSKQQRKVGQRGAELISRKAALRSAQLQVRSEIVQSASNYQQSQQQADLLSQGMIPQAKQTVASMLSGYQVGKVDFSALVQAQLMVNRLQLQYWQAISEGQIALSSLRFAVGDANLLLSTQSSTAQSSNQTYTSIGNRHE